MRKGYVNIVSASGMMKKVLCFKKCMCSRTVRDFAALYLLTFCVILPLCCQHLRHTAYERFFSRNETSEKERLIRENKARYNYSMDILKRFGSSAIEKDHEPMMNFRKALSMKRTAVLTNFTERESGAYTNGIAISIITTARNRQMQDNYKPYYLIQTVAYFLRLIHENDLKFPVYLSICNVDTHPSSHIDLQQLPKWLPVFQRFESDVNNYFSYDDLLNKEKEDYVFCLEKTMEQNLSYSLVVEDDALPHSDLISVLTTKFVQNNFRDLKHSSDILFVKLYHPERLLGYISFEWERIPELLSLALLLTLLLIHVYSKWRTVDKTSRKVLYLLLFIYTASLLLAIGRQNLLPFRRISKYLYEMTPAPSCCTPAMLYPRAGGKVVLEYLRTIRCKRGFGKDMALDKLVRERGHTTRFIQPNLFQHIGLFSAIRAGFINPFLVQ